MAKIHVDIDDTMADSTPAFINYIFEEHKIKLDKNNLGVHNYAGQLQKFIDYYRSFEKSNFFEKILPIGSSPQIIKDLSKTHELIIVSGRPPHLKEQTIEWLERFFPSCFSEVHLVNQYPREGEIGGSKHETSKKAKCDIAIDDDPETALKVHSLGIEVLLFDQPWNEKLNNGIKRVFNWEEIYEHLR